jgi:uncharacterized membrane protein
MTWPNKYRVGAVLFMVLITLAIFQAILFTGNSDDLYPWASDALGHILKVEYMQPQLAAGTIYPDIFPEWYLGIQMLRYHSPLPYYLLVGLTGLTGSAVTAGNWFIALCALGGGLSWLFYRRWIGLLPAVIGGGLYLFLPDNIRVAFAEGNLPRVLATAWLPVTVYFLLRILEGQEKRWHYLGLMLCFALLVLSHAMMAAIYAACSFLLMGLYWGVSATVRRQVWRATASLLLGIGLSGWWLLPSLTGGITELDASALTEAQAVFPLTTYLNPLLRRQNPEVVYVGAVLLLLATLALFVPYGRDKRSISLTLTGLFGILITTPVFNTLFNALPFHSLFWPLRFLGFAGFTLLLALLWRLKDWSGRSKIVSGLIIALIMVDGALSLPLIHLRPAQNELLTVSKLLAQTDGWREATFDFSRLGSAAAYFFTNTGKREQIYGWAYQGASTARNVAALNQAIKVNYTAYIFNRLTLLGVDDVVWLNQLNLTSRLAESFQTIGLTPVYTGSEVTLYHRDGAPRAFKANWTALGIGAGTQNLAYIFPRLMVGTSSYVDDYPLEELKKYQTVVLGGFKWHDQNQAETLIKQAAQAGVHVVIDLTGSPEDPLARQPHFLEVWGEGVSLSPEDLYTLTGSRHTYPLQPFSPEFPVWQTHTPQGVQTTVVTLGYLGAQTAVVGYNEYDGHKVWFVGLNLPYHLALTQDPAAKALLAEILNLPPNAPAEYPPVPLTRYTAGPNGYRFTYTLDAPDTLLVPVAYHEGTAVTIDGQITPVRSLENLVLFDAPAGEHMVEIRVNFTGSYWAGRWVSLLAIIGAVLLVTKGYGGVSFQLKKVRRK